MFKLLGILAIRGSPRHKYVGSDSIVAVVVAVLFVSYWTRSFVCCVFIGTDCMYGCWVV